MRWSLLLCFLALFACKKNPNVETVQGESKLPIMPFDAADLANGNTIYKTQCARCHGEKGKGDGESAANFDVPPTNFTSWQTLPDDKIFEWIRDGGNEMGGSFLMPGYNRTMTAQDIRDVGAYIKTLNKAK
jgi:mono/diheme cytochrome c family protein